MKKARTPAIPKKMKAGMKNNLFEMIPTIAITRSMIALIIFIFGIHETNPNTIASPDSQNTIAPLDAIASSLNALPAAVTNNPLAKPANPPKIYKMATHTFMVFKSPFLLLLDKLPYYVIQPVSAYLPLPWIHYLTGIVMTTSSTALIVFSSINWPK